MLVKGVPSWPRDMQVIGVEDRFHFLIFPQGDDLLRLYGSYQFADKSRFDGPDRRKKLIDAFGGLTCLPYAEAIRINSDRPIQLVLQRGSLDRRSLVPGCSVDRRCCRPQ
jgi:hypothetical protein